MMEEKSAWDKFFDDTEDIQCISCLDAYVLKYAIDDCWVQIDRHSSDKDSKFMLSIRGYDRENKKDLYTSDFDKVWKKKNIYDQALYKKFISGYFFIPEREGQRKLMDKELAVKFVTDEKFMDFCDMVDQLREQGHKIDIPFETATLLFNVGVDFVKGDSSLAIVHDAVKGFLERNCLSEKIQFYDYFVSICIKDL